VQLESRRWGGQIGRADLIGCSVGMVLLLGEAG